MHCREALIGRAGKIGDVLAVAPEKERQHVAALVVPCAGGRMRVVAGDDFEFRERRVAEETLVGPDLDVRGMIDGEQARLIEIVELLHRLEHAETDAAILRLRLASRRL